MQLPPRDQQALAAPDWVELVGAGFPVPLPVVRWQSFESPPDAPDVLVLSEGLPASAPEPVELAPAELPFMFAPPEVPLPEPPLSLLEPPLLVPDALLPDDEPLPDVPPPAPPELPEDWAMTEVARPSASADVASIFKIMSITFGCSSLQRLMDHRCMTLTTARAQGSFGTGALACLCAIVQRSCRSACDRSERRTRDPKAKSARKERHIFPGLSFAARIAHHATSLVVSENVGQVMTVNDGKGPVGANDIGLLDPPSPLVRKVVGESRPDRGAGQFAVGLTSVGDAADNRRKSLALYVRDTARQQTEAQDGGRDDFHDNFRREYKLAGKT